MKYKEANIERFYNARNPNLVTENKGVLFYNTGIYGSSTDNAMPSYMVELLGYSSVHSNFIGLKESQILGENLSIDDSTEPNSAELEAFMERRNKAGDNLKAVYTKLATDMSIFEAVVMQVIYDRNGKIAEIYHVPCEDFRLGVPNDYGLIEYGYISKNWANISNMAYKKKTVGNSAVQVAMFGADYKEHPVQVLYSKKYTPRHYYAVPKYLSAANEILLNQAISAFGLNNARTNYFLSGMLTQQGSPDDKEMKDFINTFTELYAGTKEINASSQKMLFSWVDDIATQKPEFTAFQQQGTDIFDTQVGRVQEAIIAGHNGYAGMIFESKGSDLGGDANKLFTQNAQYYANVSSKMKDIVLGGLNRILEINDFPKLTAITEPAHTTMPQTNVDDLTRNERRQIVFGLPPIEEGVDDKTDEIPVA